jgi:hypothetical protein
VSLEIWEFWDYNEFSARSDLGFFEGASWYWESWHDELVNTFTFGPRLVIDSKNKARSPGVWISVRDVIKI